MTKPISRKMAVDCLLYRANILCLEGIDCGECHHPIMPGHDVEFDHIHADKLGGPHEYQNLRPVHKACHKKKSARDVAALAKVDRITGKTKNGPKAKIRSPGFAKIHRPMRSKT